MDSHLKLQAGTIVCAFVVYIFFKRVEPQSVILWLVLLGCLPFCLGFQLQSSYNSLFASIFSTHLFFLGTLVSSVVIYRISPFHPLYGYPGPIILRITRFSSLKILLSGKQHLYYKNLHEKYGPYIRTGPNHLHISDAKAIPSILGSNRFLKGDRYNAVKWDPKISSLLGLADPKEHSRRRRLWDRGLNTASLKGYQNLLSHRIDQLLHALRRESTNGSIDLAKWFSFFALDFTGDLAWGGVFNSMNKGKDTDGSINLSRLAIFVHEAAGTIPWIRQIYKHLPISTNTARQLQFAKHTIQERMRRGPSETQDLFSHLIGGNDDTGEKLGIQTLISETALALTAGTDTSALTLTNMFYYLLSNPDTLGRLKAELDDACSSAGLSAKALAELPYFNAVLNETLRLQPVVPNGVQRTLIPGPSGQGQVVSDHYIPPRTNLQISTYCVHRDPANFAPRPDIFWPERWLPDIQADLHGQEKDAYRLNEHAFFPFSYGPTACPGKSLALMEMRAVTSAVLANFELKFAEGWRSEEWEDGLLDFYILRGGSLPVVLVPRSPRPYLGTK